MSVQNQPEQPNVVYSPPAGEALEAFARQVCLRLGADYLSPEIVEGFSVFIKVAADIQVKHLNKNAERVDNAE